MSELYTKITNNYDETIESIVDTVLNDSEGMSQEEAIKNEIDTKFFTYREDQDLLIAEMAKQGFIQFGQEPDWMGINEQIYADILREIQEKEIRNGR